ncbi:hypothetical protein [Baaleninema sp.]|uniref:hypothetical protein n=1 Tax=Baaleninema sp. TaxID=3101197 RepID=UPI003D08877B
MTIKLIKKNEDRWIFREGNSPLLSNLKNGLWMGGIFALLFAIAYGWRVDTLKCQRNRQNRTNCYYESSSFFETQELSISPLPRVARAEYQQSKIEYSATCLAPHYHKFYLVFEDESRQEIFPSSIDFNCQAGYPDWIQEQVDRLNQFIDSNQTELEIRRNLALYLLIQFKDKIPPLEAPLFILVGFSAYAIIFTLFKNPLRISWHFDKTTQFLYYWKTQLFRIEHLSYPFTAIVPVCRIQKDLWGNVFFTAEVELSSGESILVWKKSVREAEILEALQEFSEFVEAEIVEIDDRPKAFVVYELVKCNDTDLSKVPPEVFETCRKVFSHRHQLVRVTQDSSRLSQLNFRGIEKTQKSLEANGFQTLVDIEDQTLTEVNHRRVPRVIRLMLSRDRRTIAAIHVTPKPALSNPIRSLGDIEPVKGFELQSDLGDGTFLITATLKVVDKTSEVPGIDRRQYAHKTSVDELISIHTETLDRKISGRHPVYFFHERDAIELQHRIQDYKNQHMQAVGYVRDGN